VLKRLLASPSQRKGAETQRNAKRAGRNGNECPGSATPSLCSSADQMADLRGATPP